MTLNVEKNPFSHFFLIGDNVAVPTTPHFFPTIDGQTLKFRMNPYGVQGTVLTVKQDTITVRIHETYVPTPITLSCKKNEDDSIY